ncbi:AraC family transcriptional regulator [Pseudonocardiaceae bacterium YIM PH 21723]|nr:AraC family transcriptional regulator [Pseudonocardiaceae bacterium YIM PH 21723]
MTHRIPHSFVMALIEMAYQNNLDFDAVLVRSGISPMDLVEGDMRVTEDQAIRIYNAAREVTGDDLIGFGVAPVPLGTLRLICYAISSVTTVQGAVDRISDFLRCIPGIPDIRVEAKGRHVYAYSSVMPDPGPLHIKTVVTAAVLNRVTSWAIGRPAPLIEAVLPFAEPENVDDITLLLGDRVRFDPEATELIMVVPASLLEARIEWDERAILDYLDSAPARLLSPFKEEAVLAVRVRRLVEKDLEQERLSSAEEMAAALLISTPTLRRRLRSEGTSLREIRDDVMAKQAAEALRSTGDSVESIAKRLGFSETSAFTRAFRRWTGCSPAAFRAQGLPTQEVRGLDDREAALR